MKNEKYRKQDRLLNGHHRHRKRKNLNHHQPDGKAGYTGGLVLISACVYLYILWRTQSFLDNLEDRTSFRIPTLLLRKKSAHSLLEKPVPYVDPEGRRFLIFQSITLAQGEGNIMNGLLAAQLLGLEFNRTVCIDRRYASFHDAFQVADPSVEKACARVPNFGDLPPEQTSGHTLHLVNFISAPNECYVKERLESETTLLWLQANTYPRWPKVPDSFFTANYRARPKLLKALPYSKQPETVVHLRAPDNQKDHRTGLDEATLRALGNYLPSTTFLVTNNVEWYRFFENEFGWGHPSWSHIHHSALSNVEWGRNNISDSNQFAHSAPEDQRLALWADWYTILRSKHVYHTFSDFSRSAIHWMNIDSRVIEGIDTRTGKVKLKEEEWRVDKAAARLKDRMLNSDDPLRKLDCAANVGQGYDFAPKRIGEAQMVIIHRESSPDLPEKFIVFKRPQSGQSEGSILSGLLAAHILGIEFNRTVCVEASYRSFHHVFELVDPKLRDACSKLSDDVVDEKALVLMLSYSGVANECELKKRLSSDTRLLWLEADTYPRWPSIPDNFFFRLYRAKTALLDFLPYKKAPTTVLHVLAGTKDGIHVQEDTLLRALAKELPKDTYMLSNSVEWSDYAHEHFGWSHPDWVSVSNFSTDNGWVDRHGKYQQSLAEINTQALQMWTDWYTMLNARYFVHSANDLSQSAVHWMNIESRVIGSVDETTGVLTLEREEWFVNDVTPGLVDRARDAQGSARLRNCEQSSSTQETVAQAVGNSSRNGSAQVERFIVFRKIPFGQGEGNIMNGLLAAHLLGLEFNRTVCVESKYKEFHRAFELIDPVQRDLCESVSTISAPDSTSVLYIINYMLSIDECKIKKRLLSDEKIVWIEANTYPRWPEVPEKFFFQLYQPTKKLLEFLPYTKPPKLVVHLRAPDGGGIDKRQGLDEKSLRALAGMLPKGAYLVTNNIDLFKFFDKFGWSHPHWKTVLHSAMSSSWDASHANEVLSRRDEQMFQLWADWYTLLNAESIIHTFSDFSRSAIHWMGISSRGIDGYNETTGVLVTSQEDWRLVRSPPPLVQRTYSGEPEFQLQKCGSMDHIHFPRIPLSRNQHYAVVSLSESAAAESDHPASLPTVHNKFFVFKDSNLSQGLGNLLSGLLGVQLLGLEFNRTVCVDSSLKGFHEAFEYTDPELASLCDNMMADHPVEEGNLVSLLNFGRRNTNECDLQESFASDKLVLWVEANTYPRWPSVPKDFFFQFYRASKSLSDVFPYKQAPHTVVHLRAPDIVHYEGGKAIINDRRSGLDEATFRKLGKLLPRDTFLITNKVAWYGKFARQYGWSHPPWDIVTHSARFINWGDRYGGQLLNFTVLHQDKEHERQMYADWYTILTAKYVIHTHSDFSRSAIHWMDIDSHVIHGVENETLILLEEDWRMESPSPPLVQRTLKDKGTSKELRQCRPEQYQSIAEKRGWFF